MKNLWNAEPVAIVNAARLVALAAMTFGLHLTNVQLGASMLALEAVLTLFTRSQVTSASSLLALTPSTLQTAQDAAPQVKDTVRKLPAWLLAVCLTGLAASGCAKVPPTLTPSGVAAFNATRVVQSLDVLRDVVVAANAQIPPLVSTPTTRKVVTYHASALKTIKAMPDGWKATVQAGLDEAVKDLPPAESKQLAPYVALAKALLLAEVSR